MSLPPPVLSALLAAELAIERWPIGAIDAALALDAVLPCAALDDLLLALNSLPAPPDGAAIPTPRHLSPTIPQDQPQSFFFPAPQSRGQSLLLLLRAARRGVSWVLCERGRVPAHALALGRCAASGAALFPVRAPMGGGLHCGFLARGADPVVGYGGRAVTLKQGEPYEVLCAGTHGDGVEVREAAHGDARERAVVGGWELGGETLFVALRGRERWPGKCSLGLAGGNFVEGEKEVREEKYEVVCVEHEEDTMATRHVSALAKRQRMVRYLRSVREVIEWREEEVKEEERLKRLEGTTSGKMGAKVMHCHDMKGGYCEDADEGYSKVFDSWDMIDTFVYFSHNRLSIPPKVWIEKAQANGVQCLGTFITEHKQGELENDMLLGNIDVVVNQLVKICEVYGFDGYLINMESKVTSPSLFIEFLSKLRGKCKQRLGPRSSVIYYDSLNQAGQIQYQNCLNHENVDYFLACDGIFTNYWWNEDTLIGTKSFLAARNCDVYFGIDCFGRGKVCHGPGPECKVAADLITKHGFSMAFFAPGWTMECGPANPNLAESLDCSKAADKEFWKTVLSFGNETLLKQ